MKDLAALLNQSPTAFHCVASVAEELEKKGYTELLEKDDWKLKKGGNYFVKRNGSSIIAFSVPQKEKPLGFHIFAAHSDSPSFRIKENTEMVFENNYVRLNVEKYGGMILSTWFDRPLSIAGRVVVNGKNGLVEKLVNIDKDLCVIPNVAIHMKTDINTGAVYSVQNDLLPLYGAIESKDSFDEMIAEAAGVEKKDVLGRDLFLYARQKASKIGAKEEFILSPRLDDQACVFAGLKGLCEAGETGFVKVLAVFDNEEVGSGTKQGADSTFLEDTLFNICDGLKLTKKDYLKMVSESFLVSADNAHSVHPAMAGKADPTSRPYMNKGIVIKFSGNQKYATDAYSAAYFRKICRDKKIPMQEYSNNSDVAGGSTLGNLSTAHVSLKTVDIGLAQLAMHSCVETMGAKDFTYMAKFAKAFFEED